MRTYNNSITLNKNSRGVYSIDPSLGCTSGLESNKKGCYNDCYAARAAKVYGYDFSKTVYRYFKSEAHLKTIKRQIDKVNLPFIRMGTMGDPSEDWDHTINICELTQNDNQLSLFKKPIKEIVIITKHWNNLNDSQLTRLSKLKICINTSISVLDNKLLNNALQQYEELKNYCRSVLRIVSCDFNEQNEQGKMYSEIQESLFSNYKMLDTVLRVTKNNDLVNDEIINITESKFLGKKSYMSKYNKKTYIGKCDKCLEMCGVNL